MFLKHGDFISRDMRQWANGKSCMWCQFQCDELHHWPTKGSLGYTDDRRTIRVCRGCHTELHRMAFSVAAISAQKTRALLLASLVLENRLEFEDTCTARQYIGAFVAHVNRQINRGAWTLEEFAQAADSLVERVKACA